MDSQVSDNEVYERGFCKICGSSNGPVAFDVSTERDVYATCLGLDYVSQVRNYRRCEACNLLYRNNFYSVEVKERLYETFRDETFRGETHRDYFRRIVSLPPEKSENTEKYMFLEKHIKPNGVHLDVGGGLGVFSYGFEQYFAGWTSFCIEPTPGAGAVASENGVKFISGYLQAETNVAGGQKFDLITMNHVLEHVDSPAMLLAIVRSFLTKTGMLYLEVPDQSDCGHLPIGHDRFMSQHEVIFDQQSLSQLVANADFRVEHVEVFTSLRNRKNLRLLCSSA